MGGIDDESYGDSISEEPESDLEFYFNFLKPLILKLPHVRDRAQAAAWAVKIMYDRRATDKVKTDYFKLLLMTLHHNHLIGIFTKNPNSIFELDGFPDNLDMHEYARKILDQEIRERKERIKRQVEGQMDDIPPYYTDYSIDLREYVALQDIPGFGVHCYYAISKDPIAKWNKSQNAIIPKSTKNALELLDPPRRLSQTYLNYLASCTCDHSCDMAGKRNQANKRLKKWGLRPPMRPMGTPPILEERRPPAWGSNLIDVLDEPLSEPDSEEEILSLTAEIRKLRAFLEEYESGKLSAGAPKTPTLISKTINRISEGDQPIVERYVDVEEEESGRMVEIRENSYLPSCLKGKVRDTAVQHRIIKRNQEVQASIPARVYLPVTTPKVAPIPIRRTAEMVSEGCVTEEVPSKSVSSNFNNEVEIAKLDEELAMWVQRLQDLERECAELLKQSSIKSNLKHTACGEPSAY